MNMLKKMTSSGSRRKIETGDATLDADDLARGVAHLDDQTILQTLHDRYYARLIYSSVNRMLIAINPYEELGLYTAEKLEEYSRLGGDSAPPPHAYAVAATAFKGLLAGGSQSIVITGESGAGKTETAKRMMQFLAYMAGAAVGEQSVAELDASMTDVERRSPMGLHVQLLRTNTVMEAFGNARTPMNDNSSRFGKFLAVQYDASAKLLGAQINTYLLEKTRVVQRGEGECNFHVLYMMVLGLAPSEAGQLDLKADPESYRYTRVSDDSLDLAGREGVSWAEQLADVRTVLQSAIGLSGPEVWSTLSVLAAVLHCGNVDFATPGSGQTSMGAALNEGALKPLKALSRLLGVDMAKLGEALTSRCIRAGTEWVTKPNTTAEAMDLVDSLAKSLYARIFDSVGLAINQAIGLARRANDPDAQAHAFIGILDIFGFELFANNSLEQLLINYTNEQLQSLFNGVVFAAAMAEAKAEGVTMAAFDEAQVDNRDVLQLFTADRVGLIPVLNEECIFPKGSDETFVAKLKRGLMGKNKRLVDDSSNARADPKGTFTVRHFAGTVTYTAEGFLLKNKDPFSEDLAVLLRASSEPLVAALFAPPSQEKTASKRAGMVQRLVFKGVAPQFQAQLQRLMRVLASGQVHFVRCIKPNTEKKAHTMDDEMVLKQLKCGGVMEAVRVFAAGYPDRVMFEPFCARYGVVEMSALAGVGELNANAVKKLLAALGVPAEDFATGHTKVFLKSGVVARLERLREKLLASKAVKCQAALRGMLARKHVRDQLSAARETRERKAKAEESARQLVEMERKAEEERQKETAAAEKKAEEEKRRAAEAAAAVAAEAAAEREEVERREREMAAFRQRAAELEGELAAARAEAEALRKQYSEASSAAAANAADAAAKPSPAELEAAEAKAKQAEAEAAELRAKLEKALADLQREPGNETIKTLTATLERDLHAAKVEAELLKLKAMLAAGGAGGLALGAYVAGAMSPEEVGELRAQVETHKSRARSLEEELAEVKEALKKAREELAREKAAAEKRKAEAEATNAKWQAEAARLSAELRRQEALREAERRVHEDRVEDLTWERDFWREQTQVRFLQDAAAVEQKRIDEEKLRSNRPDLGSLPRFAKSIVSSIINAPLAGSAAREGQSSEGSAATRAAQQQRTQDVNPTCRPEPSSPAAATPGAPAARKKPVAPPNSKWDAETLEYAEYMGLDPIADEALMWIAEDLRSAPLPAGWAVQRDPNGGLYFFNEVTGESMLKHPMDLQYKQLIAEHRLEKAMTGNLAPPPAESFGTMTIRSMEDSLLVVPGAETLVSARLAVPSQHELVAGAGGDLLPTYVLHTLLSARVVPDRKPESVPVLWATCMQQDSRTLLFSIAREAEGTEFGFVVARDSCARSTLYVNEEGTEKEMSAIILREPFRGANFAVIEVVIPMPRADGKAVGVPVKTRADSLLTNYEAGKKNQLVVLTGQVKADHKVLEASLSLPSRQGETSSSAKRAPLLKMRQTAGGADMEIQYRDKITPIQAMHTVLALSRWWTMRQKRGH